MKEACNENNPIVGLHSVEDEKEVGVGMAEEGKDMVKEEANVGFAFASKGVCVVINGPGADE
eukprot:5087427-Ditylum_brightwellii.AAC.1